MSLRTSGNNLLSEPSSRRTTGRGPRPVGPRRFVEGEFAFAALLQLVVLMWKFQLLIP